MDYLLLATVIVGGYLVGAIPSGLLISRMMGRDPLTQGSGKTGATNTLRTSGPWAGIAVVVLDIAKGALVVWTARSFAWPNEAWQGLAVGAAAAAAIVGHNWSVWVRLIAGKWGGGRGILTALGAMVTINPVVALTALVIGGAVLVLTRYMAWGAIAGALAAVATLVVLGLTGAMQVWYVPGAILWGLLVVLGFHDNIGRLLKGTEPKLVSDK
ncbi:MAG TPA: glycerol-3-phosphate acyltransferase [Chloroflexia bacterium]|nr:glycerol-3-phosphate acyltransferase [Chloroflexia bacterium]